MTDAKIIFELFDAAMLNLIIVRAESKKWQ